MARPNETPTQPETQAQAPTVQDLQARIDALEKLLNDKSKQDGGIVLDAAYEQWKQWAELSAEEKTQLRATSTWGKEKAQRWTVCVPSNPEQPRITFPANSEDEARGRYLRLCGIRHCDFPVVAVPA